MTASGCAVVASNSRLAIASDYQSFGIHIAKNIPRVRISLHRGHLDPFTGFLIILSDPIPVQILEAKAELRSRVTTLGIRELMQ